jgi:hypothetical protein
MTSYYIAAGRWQEMHSITFASKAGRLTTDAENYRGHRVQGWSCLVQGSKAIISYFRKKFISMSNQDKKEGLNWWMSLFMSFHASKQCNIWNIDILGILSENPAALILSFQSLARLFTFSCSAVTLVLWPVMKCCSKWKGELKPSETHKCLLFLVFSG